VLLRFAAADKVLVSGALAGGDELAGKAALVDCSVGKGHVLLFAFNPMWRCETIGGYGVLLQAAMSWNAIAAPAPVVPPPAGEGEGG
jgi:hypothetical protein